MHFLSQAAWYPPHTLLVTQHTPADTFQITMPGTPTSPPPRRSPRSKTKGRSNSDDSESDADERTPTTPPPRRSPRSKKSARTSENSESDADEQIPTRPPRRAPRGKKKARTTSSTTSDNSESDAADRPRKKKKNTNNKGQHANTAAAGRKKFANYSEDEDYLIAMAFVHVTVDPIRGVGQKSETFWTRVHEKFCLLQQKELPVIGFDIIVRTRDSIEQRWKKRISRSVQLWNKHYRQLKGMQKSGWNEDKYIEEASALYKSDTGETFRFAKCVPVLHKLPKFDPMVLPPTKASSPQSANLDALHSTGPDDDDEEFIPESALKKKAALVNNSAPPQGSNMERPIGMKKAKLIKKLEDSGVLSSVAPGLLTDSFDTRNAGEENKMMADMSSAT